MRVLVNYDPVERPFLIQLQYFMKKAGLTGVTTSKTLTAGELVKLASNASCGAILVCNEATLQDLVPGKKPTLNEWRGSRLPYPVPIFVLNKLAHINTLNHGKWLLEKDLEKVTFASIQKTPFSCKVLSDVEMLEAAYSTLSKAVIITFDVETDCLNEVNGEDEDGDPIVEAGDAVITCCSWTALMEDGSLYTCVLPLIDFGAQDHWRTNEEYEQALLFFRAVNALPVVKGMHNGTYDCVYAIMYGAAPLNYTLDTLGLAHSEFSELPKTLDFVASYTLYDYKQWKIQSDEAKKNKDQRAYYEYNGLDTWYTMRILLSQLENYPKYAKQNYAMRFKMTYPFLYCAFEGWKVDNAKRKELRHAAVEKRDKALTALRTAFADPNFNPGSWQQVSKYLYDVIGAQKPKLRNAKSAAGTDEKHLKIVAEQHPMLALLVEFILDYREAAKAISTYFDFRQRNGRLLYAINPFGTESARSSSNGSALYCGTQVQNIPAYAKDMLVADEGYEAAEIDNSQSEARCVAYLAKCKALQQALETEGKDFYRTLGTLLLGIPYEEVDDFIRNKIIKKICHGTNYVMGAGTYVENTGAKLLFESAARLGITLVEIPRRGHSSEMTILQFAKMCLESYHKPFPEIRQGYSDLKAEIIMTGFITSPSGYTRKIFGDIEKNNAILRSAIAHRPQNLSVVIVDRGVWRAYKETLKSNGKFRLKMQVHDSIGAQWMKEDRDTYASLLKELCDNPVDVYGQELRIPTDLKVGNSWGTMEKIKLVKTEN